MAKTCCFCLAKAKKVSRKRGNNIYIYIWKSSEFPIKVDTGRGQNFSIVVILSLSCRTGSGTTGSTGCRPVASLNFSDDWGNCPALSFLVFLGKKGKENPKKARIVYPYRTPQILGWKRGNTLVTRKCSYRPQNPGKFKDTKKWLKSDFWGSGRSDSKVT